MARRLAAEFSASVMRRSSWFSVISTFKPLALRPNALGACHFYSKDTSSSLNTPLSPTLQEYLRIKERHPAALLLYQIGDFYEAFGADALRFSAMADVKLCERSKPNATPMTGVPVRSVSLYIERLVRQGMSVVLYDQVALSATDESTRMVRRLSRLVTPGTVLEEGAVSSKDNRFILAISRDKKTVEADAFSLAWADVSTGAFHVHRIETANPDVTDAIKRVIESVAPVEILLDARHFTENTWLVPFAQKLLITHSFVASAPIDEVQSYELLFKERVNASTLDSACVVLLNYLFSLNIASEALFDVPSQFNEGSHLALDENIFHALEIFKNTRDGSEKGSLFDLLDRTVTGCGSRLLRQRLKYPSTEVGLITHRLDCIDFFRSQPSFVTAFRDAVRKLPDFERALQRIAVARSLIPVSDLHGVLTTLRTIRALGTLLKEQRAAEVPVLRHLWQATAGFGELEQVLSSALSPTVTSTAAARNDEESGFIREGFDVHLDELRTARETLHDQAAICFLKLKQSLPSVSMQLIKKPQSWLVETRTPLEDSLGLKFEGSTGKLFRYKYADLEALYEKSLLSQLLFKKRETEIFANLKTQISAHAAQFKRFSVAVSELDVAAAMASFHTFCRPQITEASEQVSAPPGQKLVLQDSFHPVLEQTLACKFKNVVRNSCVLHENDFWLITGPNMGGKSTFLRQIALTVVLGQAGLYVPAEAASFSPFSSLFCRIGSADDITRDKSTFMAEMHEIADIFKRATANSLVLMDEIGRGTSFDDGVALSRAISEHLLQKVRAVVIFATHFHELATTLPAAVRRYKTTALLSATDGICFSYKMELGTSRHSYGIEVAELAGLPDAVIARARALKDGNLLETSLQQQPQSNGSCVVASA